MGSSGTVSEILADVTFVTEFVTSHFAPNAECQAQAEAFGPGNAWTTVQSICVPKISPLSGPVSEILADVTFVTDGRTDAHTHTNTHKNIFPSFKSHIGPVLQNQDWSPR